MINVRKEVTKKEDVQILFGTLSARFTVVNGELGNICIYDGSKLALIIYPSILHKITDLVDLFTKLESVVDKIQLEEEIC